MKQPMHPAPSSTTGAAINLLGEVLELASGPLFFWIISKWLGSDMLGNYILATTYVALLYRMSVIGYDKGMLRYIPISLATKEAKLSLAATVGTAVRRVTIVSLFWVILVFGFPDFFLKIGGDGEARTAAVWLSLMIFALPAQAVLRVLLFAARGMSNMWMYVIVQNLTLPLLLLVASIVPLFLGYGEMSLVFGFVFSAFISLAIAVVLFHRQFPSLSLAQLVRSPSNVALSRFSYPQGATETLNFLLARVDILMIAWFFSDRPELVAVYGIASLMAGAIKKIKNSFDNSFSPLFATGIANNDRELMQREYQLAAKWMFLLFIWIGGGISFASFFALKIFDASFSAHWIVVPILIGGRLLNAAGGPMQASLLMSGRSKLELLNNVMINIANIGLNLLFIPMYHIYGAAMATSLSLTLFNFTRMIQVKFILQLHANIILAIRYLAAGILSAAPLIAVLHFFPNATLVSIGLTTAYLLLYPLAVIAVGGKKEIFSLIGAVIKKIKRKLDRPGASN